LYIPCAPVGGKVSVVPSGFVMVIVNRYLSVDGVGTCGLKNMKVISWPAPTGLGVTDMKTAVGTVSFHRVHMSNLVVEAFMLSAPVKSHFMPAALAAAVALSKPALTGCIAKSGIASPIIKIAVIKVAIVLFFIVCIFILL
jgi:hypothetical protein